MKNYYKLYENYLFEGSKGRIITIDTKTTGLGEDDELLQIAIIDQINGKILLHSYVRLTQHTSWDEAQGVHHITPEKVANAPTAEELAEKVSEIFANSEMVLAYNVDFDMRFIKPLLLPAYEYDYVTRCVMKMFADYYREPDKDRGGYKWKNLSFAAKYLKIKWIGKAHDALADAEMCANVFDCMLDNYDRIRTLCFKLAQIEGIRVDRNFEDSISNALIGFSDIF